MSSRIHALLEAAYADFHCGKSREKDPVSLVHPYADSRDREISALFAALLAYGNVQTILTSVRNVLKRLAPSPYQALVDRRFDFSGFRHRFTNADDLQILSQWVATALQTHGSLQAFFVDTRADLCGPMRPLLSDFVRRLESLKLPAELERLRTQRTRTLKYLVSDPERGSACKRLNMFLRWMVRKEDGIDLGLWTRLHTRQLMLPVDTHLLQTLRALRWTRSQQANWKVVEAATRRLRQYAPEDPIRYDFALCHLSMAGGSLRQYGERSPGAPLE